MLDCVILAAGEGTRMNSKYSKVLHKVCGAPIIDWVVSAAEPVADGKVIVVVGNSASEVRSFLGDRVEFAEQKERLGTGHACMQAKDAISADTVLVLAGDTPLITAESLKKAAEGHASSGACVTVVTAELKEPEGYGRIVRANDGSVLKIVEEKDASEEEKLIREVNSGIYLLDAGFLKSLDGKLTTGNSQGEFYLTDCVEIALGEGKSVAAVKLDDNKEILGINSRHQQAKAENHLRKRIVKEHMRNGVSFVGCKSAHIGKNVKIGRDTVIYQNTTIEGDTVIGEDCEIRGCRIADTTIGNGSKIENSVVLGSVIGDNTTVGPFAYIRPGCEIGTGNRIGDFVELKNSKIGDGTKVSHLTYVGDADVGKNVNFGCGSVVVNYDGKKKHRSTVEDGAFIGCNVNLISPVTVEKDAFLAAGSTITKNVPQRALAIARSKQENKENWNKKGDS